MSSSTHYWRHTIRHSVDSGGHEPLEVYVSATTREAVEQDLKSGFSHLRSYLNLFNYPAEKYVEQHPERAEQLLGGMAASHHFLLRTGLWLPVDPPPTISTTKPINLGDPISQENGLSLWIESQENFEEKASKRFSKN